MPRDTLYVLPAGFTDAGQRWFCPYSAQVIGLLTYYPELRETLEVKELDFPRPRQPLASLLGEANQSLPVLVLDPGSPAVEGITIETANGHRFISATIDILRYLTATRGLPPPH